MGIPYKLYDREDHVSIESQEEDNVKLVANGCQFFLL